MDNRERRILCNIPQIGKLDNICDNEQVIIYTPITDKLL